MPKLANGEWTGCLGLTEPTHGSDPGSRITRAKKVDGGYVLKDWLNMNDTEVAQLHEHAGI